MTNRRTFIQQGAAAMAATALPLPGFLRDHRPRAQLVDLMRPPDRVVVETASGVQALSARPGAAGRWEGSGVNVQLGAVRGAARLQLSAPTVGVARVGLRWNERLDATRLVLGDAWERGYGDLEWRGLVPDRVMPWYVLASDGARTDGYGVRTGANAFCFWQVDAEGISLWADVRSGGVPVQLGARALDVCDVVCRAGADGESPFAALHAFCRQMCPDPRLPAAPVYGHNDWYYAYGDNSAATMRADAEHIVALSPCRRQPALRGDRRRLAAGPRRQQGGRRTVGSRQREVSRHPRVAGRRDPHGRAPRGVDSAAAGARRRAG